MTKLPKKYSAAWLLKNLKDRPWDEERLYNHLYLVPGRTKHDSGFMHIALVGIEKRDEDEYAEIAAWPDDVVWDTKQGEMTMRTDCFYPSGVMRFWSSRHKFHVGHSLSSTTVTLV